MKTDEFLFYDDIVAAIPDEDGELAEEGVDDEDDEDEMDYYPPAEEDE